MTTAIITSPLHALHDEPSHEEQAARLLAIEAALDKSGLRADVVEFAAQEATEAQILAVHQRRLLEIVRSTASRGPQWLGLDTYTMPGSWEAARTAAGAAVRAAEAVVTGQVSNAFALIRPPGHHATPSQPMGFCLLNNVAIATRHALEMLGLERVAIVDFDVHHGNGTQDCFYDDGRVFFCSTHASPLYPGTGAADEVGIEDGYGTTLNLPLPYGTGDAGFQLLYDEVVLPALRRFSPQLILVSAGYDAHWDDPLGPLSLSIRSWAWNQAIMELGALICTAAAPACWRCPVQAHCRAYAARRAADERLFSNGAAPPSVGIPPEPARLRRVAERREAPYAGSNRFYRGRAIEALRQLAPGQSLPLPALGRQIKDGFDDDDMPWLRALVEGLARDGLLAFEDEQARLP